ncbi:MAG: hypothetical protein AAF493_10980 [Pseudomonadota bacterium]
MDALINSDTVGAVIALFWPAQSIPARAIVIVIAVLLVYSVLRYLTHRARLAREEAQVPIAARCIRDWRRDRHATGIRPDLEPNVELKSQVSSDATSDGVETKSAESNAEAAAPPDSSVSGASESVSTSESVESSGTSTPERPRLPELKEQLVQLEKRLAVGSHLRRRVEAIRLLRSHQVRVNLNTLQLIVAADERSRSRADSPRQIAATVMMLGILGTFFGLAEVVRKVEAKLTSSADLASQPNIGVDQYIKSIQQVNEVLAGMSTAFSTSLAGILAAVICSALGYWLQNRQARMVKSLEEFTATELLPTTVPALEDDSVLEQISGQLERAFSDLEDVVRENGNSVREITTAQENFQKLFGDFQAMVRGHDQTDVDKLVTEINKLTSTNREVASGFPDLHRTLRDLYGSIDDRLDKGIPSFWKQMAGVIGAALCIGIVLWYAGILVFSL